MDDNDVPKVSVHGNLFKTIVSGNTSAPPGVGRLRDHLPPVGARDGARHRGRRPGGLRQGDGRALRGPLRRGSPSRSSRPATLIIPVVAPMGAAITTSLVGLLWQIVEEQKQKGRIKGMFGTYVSPAVVESMVNSGRGPEARRRRGEHHGLLQRHPVVLQLLGEALPDALVELMNQYLTVCTDSIQAGRHARQVHRRRGGRDLRRAARHGRPRRAGLRRGARRSTSRLATSGTKWIARATSGRRSSTTCRPASGSTPGPRSSATWEARRASATR
jgi:hypothetical protein